MKTTIAASLVLLLFVLGIAYSQNKGSSPNPGNPGKFQIVPAEYLYMAKGATLKQPGVFRLNTETGETWIYVHLLDDQGKFVEKWSPVP
jgi:hypothetical protein